MVTSHLCLLYPAGNSAARVSSSSFWRDWA